jgi:hypothetical protein
LSNYLNAASTWKGRTSDCPQASATIRFRSGRKRPLRGRGLRLAGCRASGQGQSQTHRGSDSRPAHAARKRARRRGCIHACRAPLAACAPCRAGRRTVLGAVGSSTFSFFVFLLLSVPVTVTGTSIGASRGRGAGAAGPQLHLASSAISAANSRLSTNQSYLLRVQQVPLVASDCHYRLAG